MNIVLKTIIPAMLGTALAGSALAGNITGELRSARGDKLPNIVTSCNIYGDNGAGGGSGTTRTVDGDVNLGVFYWAGLAQGTYTQAMSEALNYGILYRKGISVPASGDATYTVMQYNPSHFVVGNEWFTTWSSWYAQSFKATGSSIYAVSMRCAGSSSAEMAVSIHDGDNPGAPQIGPTRYLTLDTSDAHDPRTAYWSAGEVPTVPGQVYTVRFSLVSGGTFSPWRQTVKVQMRDEIPEGRTWADGNLVAGPLETTITMDDQGFVHTMCTARRINPINVGSYGGQTFVAKGSSVLAVTWAGWSTARWAISIHDGPGSGSGGVQIGPTKYVNGISAGDGRSIVTFAPGEVPTVPGQTYFAKLRLADNSSTWLYNAGISSMYSGGQAYFNNTAQSYDFSLGIYEETFTNSLDRLVSISSYRVDTITSNSAVVRWGTNRSSDSTVEYSEVTPYANSKYDSTLTLNHAVTLTGLKPNTMYHVRAASRASGWREGTTRDMVFVTAPATPNLLTNSGFETGSFAGWTKYGSGDIRVTGPTLGGAGPRTGSYGLAGMVNGGTVKGGAYQRVAALPGIEYKLSAWLYTYCVGNFWTKSHQTVTRIGIDPAGGIDSNSASIIWSPYTNSQEAWTPAQVAAVAAGSYITVFLYGGNDQSIQWSIFAFDDAVLTVSQTPTDATVKQALRDHADGAYLRVSGAICTATSAQAGAYYIQTEDRVSGLRVETADTMLPGERVTVQGTIQTRTTGERCLADAVVLSRTASTTPTPLYIRPSSIGGRALGQFCIGIPDTEGPYNVGLLARAFGNVTATGSNAVFINDGSLPGDGLRIRTNALTVIPTVGQKVAVTGIVQLQGTAAAPVATLRPRGDADVRVFAP